MIVDDHPVVRDGLKNMLLAFDDLLLVGEAGDGNQAVIGCRQTQPDVILMDVMMHHRYARDPGAVAAGENCHADQLCGGHHGAKFAGSRRSRLPAQERAH
jgi:CheY-like chemotaxis protein